MAAARSLARTTPLHLLGDPSRTAFTTTPHLTLWGQDARRRQLDTTRGVAPPHVQLPAPLQRTPLADPLYPFFRFRQLFSRSPGIRSCHFTPRRLSPEINREPFLQHPPSPPVILRFALTIVSVSFRDDKEGALLSFLIVETRWARALRK